MNTYYLVAIGILIPFLGTTIGSGFVFFLRDKLNELVQKLLLGFAAGVMIAASVWSLLIPAIDMTEQQGGIAWLPPAIGFLLGIGFLLVLDSIIPHLHVNSNVPEGRKSNLGKSTMLVLAVTLHNIPEGMAVGIVFASMLAGNLEISTASAFALSLGIALQNVPEGAIISLPLAGSGAGKHRAFTLGMLSGAVEPVGALLTILLTAFIVPALPYMLAFAAGAMIYVVIEELVPESQSGDHSNIGTVGAALGFVLMMILDVALG